MYVPSSFAETRVEIMHALIQQYPLGNLVTLDPDGLTGNHLPFELADSGGEFGVLRAHVARNNPFWRSVSRDVDALVMFQGPQAYISPGWYPSKAIDGRAVPTWNYISVHAHGPLQMRDDAEWLRAHLGRLTQKHEAGQPVPWRLDEAPPAYLEQLLTLIVGIEIPIGRLQGKWKVSQNRSDADRDGVIAGLQQQSDVGAAAMALAVRRRR